MSLSASERRACLSVASWIIIAISVGAKAESCGNIASVPIHYSNPSSKSDPSIDATINGVSGKFIIDTGTSHHLIFKPLLKAAALDASDGYNERSISIAVGSDVLKFPNFLALDPIIPLQNDGYSGILSVSKFAEVGSVVLDFKLNMLRIDAQKGRSAKSFADCLSIDLGHALQIPWVGRPYGVVYVSILLEGKPHLMNLDTGSSISTIESAVRLSRPADSEGPQMMDVDGKIRKATAVSGVDVILEGRVFPLKSLAILDDTSALPDGTKWEGKLGMDLVGRFKLLLPGPGMGEMLFFE